MDQSIQETDSTASIECLTDEVIGRYASGENFTRQVAKDIELHLETCKKCHDNYIDYLERMFEYT